MSNEEFILEQVKFCREDLGLDDNQAVPTDFENLIVTNLGYEYEEVHEDADFHGYSQCIDGLTNKICYNSARDYNNNLKRFTIAHELGHWYLHHEYLTTGIIHRSTNNYRSQEKIEQEADTFAINLLAPQNQFKEKMKYLPFSISTISNLADIFGISFIASAIRFVKLSKGISCTFICCNKEHYIEYDCRSSDFYYEYKHQSIKRGKSPYNRSIRESFTAEGFLEDWYPNIKNNIKTQESIMPLGYDGKYIVLIEPETRSVEEEIEF